MSTISIIVHDDSPANNGTIGDSCRNKRTVKIVDVEKISEQVNNSIQ